MEKLTVLMAGLGNVAHLWLPSLKDNADLDLVAVVDPRGEQLVGSLAPFGLAHVPVERDLDAALVRHRPDIVLNLTPAAVHGTVIRKCFDAGCHVFTEKPLSDSFSESRALADLADSYGLRLSVMQNRRFVAPIRRLRDGIAAGRLGELTVLASDQWMSPRLSTTYLERLRHPMLQDMAVHTFDQARFLSGSDAIRVSAFEYNPRQSWYLDNAAAICTFELDGGEVFTYRGNWVAPGFATSYDSQWRAAGTAGTALWDGWDDTPPRYQSREQASPGDMLRTEHETWEVSRIERSGHDACLREMTAALRSDRPAETNAHDNLGTLAMVFAAIMSAEQRRWVDIQELFEESDLVQNL